VAFDGRRVVSKRLGQDRNLGEFGELVQCAEPCGACAEDLTKSVAEVTSVDVATGCESLEALSADKQRYVASLRSTDIDTIGGSERGPNMLVERATCSQTGGAGLMS
jgi:hypothetical protein